MTSCWCGNAVLIPFSAEYAECGACGTLISQVGVPADSLRPDADESGFYGKEYWLSHQSQKLGFPDIHQRARLDLSERNLHWLKTLLRYRAPGSQVLELGCSHGGFVALMSRAGYNAVGVELSPWVVDFAKRTFDVSVLLGPVEKLDLPSSSLDVIVLMDVLEHLPSPVETMAHCLRILKDDGLLLIQTPRYTRGSVYEDLVATHAPFLEMLQGDEHLYLFTEESVARLFHQLGATQIQFEPAIFDRYDMFFVVSRVPLHTFTEEQVAAALESTPGGRITQAMLDLRERELHLSKLLGESEVDRGARGEQIETLTRLLKECEADRAARGEQIGTLTNMVRASEALNNRRQQQMEAAGSLASRAEEHIQDERSVVAALLKKIRSLLS
jgi:2-polyprenyl-3-methyl-5-hydroxy-6-metoxy-1,4-benzoquinol methylase